MNTPHPCCRCRHLYYDVMNRDDPDSGCECNLGHRVSKKHCEDFEDFEEQDQAKEMPIKKCVKPIHEFVLINGVWVCRHCGAKDSTD